MYNLTVSWIINERFGHAFKNNITGRVPKRRRKKRSTFQRSDSITGFFLNDKTLKIIINV